MDLGIPPLEIKIMLESSPLKPTMLVGRLGVPNRNQVRGWLILGAGRLEAANLYYSIL